MNMLPELVKLLGPGKALMALAGFIISGWAATGVIIYFFWRHVTETNKANVTLMQQVLKDQRAEHRQHTRDVKDSYRDGYLTGREHERQSADERTPPEGMRWHKKD